MGDHPLMAQVRRATHDRDRHAQTAQIIATVHAALDAALGCDAVTGRDLLPTALTTLYRETQCLLGMGLVSSTVWIDQQHARLFQRAQQLYGAEAGKIVQPPPHEPMPASPRGGRAPLPEFWWNRR